MTTLVSSIMSLMTVSKAGKEVAGKWAFLCTSLLSGRKSFPETSAEFPSNFIWLQLVQSLAEGNRITVAGLDPCASSPGTKCSST